MAAHLHAVPDEPVETPAEAYAYEAEQRRRIMARDWARVHIAADRRPALPFFDRIKRTWR